MLGVPPWGQFHVPLALTTVLIEKDARWAPTISLDFSEKNLLPYLQSTTVLRTSDLQCGRCGDFDSLTAVWTQTDSRNCNTCMEFCVMGL